MKNLNFVEIINQTDQKIAEVIRAIEDQKTVRSDLEKDPVYQRYLATQREISRLNRKKEEISPNLKYVGLIKAFAEEHRPEVLFNVEHKEGHGSFDKVSLRRYQLKSRDSTEFFGLWQKDSYSGGDSEELRVFSPLDERIIAEIIADPMERLIGRKEILNKERIKRIKTYFRLGESYDPDSVYKFGSWVIVNSRNKEENLHMDKYFISDLVKDLMSKL